VVEREAYIDYQEDLRTRWSDYDKIELVIFGWGIEFGRYFCGGAPERWDDELQEILPPVPVSWSWGLGVHYRAPWVCRAEGRCNPWGWHRRWWNGKDHECTLDTLSKSAAGRDYFDRVLEVREVQ
jgi:hypothetical protein